MRKGLLGAIVIASLSSMALPAAAADGDPWLCKYKGYDEAGMHYYIVVRPFDGPADRYSALNDNRFGHALFERLTPGKRFSGETACAQRPREMTEKWFQKIVAGDDMFSSRSNTTLAEWKDGNLVALPWPKDGK